MSGSRGRRREPSWRRGSIRLYRTLLWLYPPSLRSAHGEEMLQLFRDTLRDEVARSGPPGALRAWGATLADLAVSVPREWPREIGQRRARSHRGRIARHALGQVAVNGGGVRRGELEFTMSDKFEKFTERARKVMSLAQEEAQRFNHNYIGAEHILLGLVREGDGVAAKALDRLGIELQQVRNAVEFIIGRGDRIVLSEVGLTPRAKKVIELAVDEARRLNHHYIGTEHLLLGLLREGEGIAAGVLESLGVNLDRLRAATVDVLTRPEYLQLAVIRERDGIGGQVLQAQTQPRRSPAELGRFTSSARQVIADTITEARERSQREVGTGHALLALLRDEDGVAAQTLRQAGIDLDRVRREIEQTIGPRPPAGEQAARGPVGLDSHMLRVIAISAVEAGDMHDQNVGPEHLLLAIIREGDGLGGQVLLAQTAILSELRSASMQIRARAADTRDKRPTLGRLTLICRDVETTSLFYTRNFAAETVIDDAAAGEPSRILRLPGGGPLLALRQATAPLTQAGAATIELDIWVGDITLIWRTLQDNAVAGVATVNDRAQGRAFTVPDPDGRVLRVYAHGGQQPGA